MAAKKPQSQSKARTSSQGSGANGARLLGKVAVVTGASRGIGYAVANALGGRRMQCRHHRAQSDDACQKRGAHP